MFCEFISGECKQSPIKHEDIRSDRVWLSCIYHPNKPCIKDIDYKSSPKKGIQLDDEYIR